jgi:hypothetical protein
VERFHECGETVIHTKDEVVALLEEAASASAACMVILPNHGSILLASEWFQWRQELNAPSASCL